VRQIHLFVKYEVRIEFDSRIWFDYVMYMVLRSAATIDALTVCWDAHAAGAVAETNAKLHRHPYPGYRGVDQVPSP
jgi:hypothetical protein